MQYGEKFIATAAKYGKSIGKLELEVETTTGSVGVISTNSRVVQNNDAVQYGKYLWTSGSSCRC